MATAYTPGLKVSPFTRVRKTRRLPLKGQVLVKEGDWVEAHTVVARTEIPGILHTVRVAQRLGVEPSEVQRYLKVKIGDTVAQGDLLAESRSLFGLLKTVVKSPLEGVVEYFSEVSGNLGIRAMPTPVERKAYIRGVVAQVLPEEGVEIETEGAFIQGIFGVGGERQGYIRVAVQSPEDPLLEEQISSEDQNKILVGGACIAFPALQKASQVGVSAIVVGGIRDQDLIQFVGHDIGVAITGQEEVPLTLILTEGFGYLPMAKRTFELFQQLEGRFASVNGQTQIRAGVVRPEIIVPLVEQKPSERLWEEENTELEIGTSVRIIRTPYFGLLGIVEELPPEPEVIPTGAKVRVARIRLQTGEKVTVPRANVEIISR